MKLFLLFQLLVQLVGYGTPVMLLAVLGTGAAYCYYFLYRRKLVEAMKQNVFLAAFVLQGAVWCALSLLGMAGWFALRRHFPVDLSYLPRQAFYLAFLPLVAATPYFEDNDQCRRFLLRYGKWAVPVYLAYKLLVFHTIGLNNLEMLLLSVLALWAGEYKPLDFVNAGLLVLGTLMAEQTATLLLGAMFLGVFALRRLALLRWLACATLPVLLVASFVLPQFDRLNQAAWDLDANTGWRLYYWQDEATALWDTRGVGIGFGTTYASQEFSEPQSELLYNEETGRDEPRPFSANGEYTKEQRPFVTASHNSFVSVAFRQGILGITAFALFLLGMWKKVFFYRGCESSALIFGFCAAALLIGTNVGLESPMYLFPAVGVWGLIAAVAPCPARQPSVEADEPAVVY